MNIPTESRRKVVLSLVFKFVHIDFWKQTLDYIDDQYTSHHTALATKQRQGFCEDINIGGESLGPRTVWGYYEETWKQVKKKTSLLRSLFKI